MSLPVMYMVSITLSSDTRGLEVRRRAIMLGGVDRLHGGDGVALDAGHPYLAGHRVAGQTQVVFHADLGGFTDMSLKGCRPSARSGRRRHGAGDAHFT